MNDDDGVASIVSNITHMVKAGVISISEARAIAEGSGIAVIDSSKPTTWDEDKYDVEQFLRDRFEGVPWSASKGDYRRKPEKPKPAIQKEMQLCPRCDCTYHFYVDDYICTACRQGEEEEDE